MAFMEGILFLWWEPIKQSWLRPKFVLWQQNNRKLVFINTIFRETLSKTPLKAFLSKVPAVRAREQAKGVLICIMGKVLYEPLLQAAYVLVMEVQGAAYAFTDKKWESKLSSFNMGIN